MARKKTKKRRAGRPSKGPAVSVTFLLPKRLNDRLKRLCKRAAREMTRTEALQRAIQAGLEKDEKLLASID